MFLTGQHAAAGTHGAAFIGGGSRSSGLRGAAGGQRLLAARGTSTESWDVSAAAAASTYSRTFCDRKQRECNAWAADLQLRTICMYSENANWRSVLGALEAKLRSAIAYAPSSSTVDLSRSIRGDG